MNGAQPGERAMFSRILLPVDGSDHARKAAAVAGDLAAKYDAEVLILHVIDESRLREREERMAEVEHVAARGREPYPWVANTPADLAAMLQPDEATARRERMLEYLSDEVVHPAAEELGRHGVAPGHVRVVFKNGHPVRRILETCEEEGSDAVVMGSRGLADLAGAIEGSVSHRVAHRAPCTVITVK